jgi:twinkle protein
MDAMEWLTRVRKLDARLVASMGVKAGHKPGLGDAVAFPYTSGGKVVAFKYRAVDRKAFLSTPGVSRGLYNFENLACGKGPIVVTEGEIDALSCVQAGYDRSVSLPDGWTEDGGKRQVLIEAEAALRDSPWVIVAGDTDAAGASLPKTVANILAGHDVRFAVWPDGCKDANDVLVKFGEGELARCLLEAKRIDPPGGFITGISDLPPLPDRRVLRMGMAPFDFALAFEVGAMSVGTGTPGAGKSTFTTFAAYHVAMAENVRVGFMSFETHPHRTRDHLCRLAMGRKWADLSEAQQIETAKRLDENFRLVHRTFGDDAHHLKWAEAMVYTLAVRDGCKMIVLDPWNELEHMPMPGESMTAYINFALQQIRQWAERWDCHICVVAHPRKMMTDGKMRSPTGYDIADSAAFFNKPALGFSVHQDETPEGEQFVRLTTWKVRDRQLYGIHPQYIDLTFSDVAMSYRRFEGNSRYMKKDAAK